RDIACGRVVVKDGRDEGHGEDQASRDSPPELVPYRVEGYFLAKPLALDVSAVEKFPENCPQRAKHELKHGAAPFGVPWCARALLAARTGLHLSSGPHRPRAMLQLFRQLDWWEPQFQAPPRTGPCSARCQRFSRRRSRSGQAACRNR